MLNALVVGLVIYFTYGYHHSTSQKKNKSGTSQLLIFHISKAFTQNFMGLCDGDKGLRIDLVNHVLHFDDFVPTDDTVNNFKSFCNNLDQI